MNSTTCTDSNSSDEDDMKKLLIASTALSLAGGAALAEISVSGDAELGVDYNSEASTERHYDDEDGKRVYSDKPTSKHSFVHEVGIDFSGSGTTDGGLSFGGSAGFDTNDDTVNLGTVHVSGSFGTLTIGDNDPASFAAGGIADIGLNGIGVDDVAEGPRKGTNAALRYDNSFGQVSIAISAGTKDGVTGVEEVLSEKRNANSWVVSSRVSNVVSVFHSTRPTAVQFDPLYGVTRASDGSTLTFDHDADGAATDDVDEGDTAPIDIHGFGIVEGVLMNGETTRAAVDLTTDAGKAQKAAYDLYVAAYDLGADKAVGGANTAGGAQNADTVKNDDGNGVIVSNYHAGGDVITKGVDAVKAKTEFAFGMSFDAGGVTIGVGYDSNKTVSMGAGFSAGEISTNLLYVKRGEDHADGEATGLGADMSYAMGASTVTLAYGRNKPEMGKATTAVGMGVTHDLGGGATMNAGFGKVDKMMDGKIVGQNKASIGIGFKF